MPLISIIMPTYNGEAYVAEALGGIVRQQDSQIEVIVVDDGSTDRTLEIVEQFRSSLPLEVLRLERAGSWVKASNHGVRVARGELISFLHQDDYWLPKRLASLRAALRRDPQADVFVHPSRYVSPDSKPLGTLNCPLPQTGRVDPTLLFERLIVQNFISMPAPLIRREALLRAGGFDATLWYTADWKLWLTLAVEARWHYLKEPLACFRIHQHAQTVRSSHSSQDFRMQHFRVLEELLPAGAVVRTLGPARCAIELNVALAAAYHRVPIAWRPLLRSLLSLGPRGAVQLVRYSRLHERIQARIRCGLLSRSSA